jgi:hypothetical protein
VPRERLGRRPACRSWHHYDWRAAWVGHLHDPLAVLLQHHRQAGAEAARPLDRPQTAARKVTVRKAEQLLVARRIGTGGGLGEHPAEIGDGCRGQGVAVVSTPMTPSTSSASMVMRWSSLGGAAVVGVGLGGVTARHNCDGSQPVQGWTGC